MKINEWSGKFQIAHYFLIFKYNCQFDWSNSDFSTSKYYFDTPAMKNRVEMVENFRLTKIWSIVLRKEKLFLCPAFVMHGFHKAYNTEGIGLWYRKTMCRKFMMCSGES